MDVNGPRCQHASVGPLLCLLSAAGFGAMAIFGKLAYDAGVGVGDLLLAALRAGRGGAARGRVRRAARCAACRAASCSLALAMGAVGYATQSGLFFSALERMDASLLALILYTYPALVLRGGGRARARARVGAADRRAAGRARPAPRWCSPARRRASFDALGAAMGFGAALAYTVVHPRRRPRR